jgi:hypothetical protein
MPAGLVAVIRSGSVRSNLSLFLAGGGIAALKAIAGEVSLAAQEW